MDLLKSMGIPVYTMSEMLAGAPAVDTNLTSSYTLPEPPRGDPRFGPGLYQLHDRILQGTQVGSPLSVLVLFVLPFFLLYAQTWLLVGDKKGTRPIRAAIAAAHSALWWKGISTWRFTGECGSADGSGLNRAIYTFVPSTLHHCGCNMTSMWHTAFSNNSSDATQTCASTRSTSVSSCSHCTYG